MNPGQSRIDGGCKTSSTVVEESADLILHAAIPRNVIYKTSNVCYFDSIHQDIKNNNLDAVTEVWGYDVKLCVCSLSSQRGQK